MFGAFVTAVWLSNSRYFSGKKLFFQNPLHHQVENEGVKITSYYNFLKLSVHGFESPSHRHILKKSLNDGYCESRTPLNAKSQP
jgi:hypothetical protein